MKYPPASDQLELVAQAREGDRRAFDALCLAHLPRILRTCRHLGFRGADAADLSQELLLEVWVRLPDLRDASRFQAWYGQILRRMAYNRRNRGSAMNRGAMQPLPDPTGSLEGERSTRLNPALVTSEDTITAPLEQREAREIINGVIDAIPNATMKDVAVRHYLQEQSLKEIVEDTGIGENTVLSHLRRFRLRCGPKLRERLGEGWPFSSAGDRN